MSNDVKYIIFICLSNIYWEIYGYACFMNTMNNRAKEKERGRKRKKEKKRRKNEKDQKRPSFSYDKGK